MKEFEYHNKIMGCELDISIITDANYKPNEIFNECFKKLETYESIFSRFDKKSELSLLNKEKERYVSDIFWEVFLEAEKLYIKSNSVFNPLSQVEQFGYVSDFSQKDYFKKKNVIQYNDNFLEIIIDRENKYINLQKDQKLDFGGFLKGYVAQKISQDLFQFNGSIVNIGGDIYAQGNDENNNDFNFSIYNPITKEDIFEITLDSKSLSTSGTYKRNWEIEGKIISHIIDSDKKESIQSDIISASIVSDDGAQSDAWATLSIVLGVEKACKFLENTSVKYIFITQDGLITHNFKKI